MSTPATWLRARLLVAAALLLTPVLVGCAPGGAGRQLLEGSTGIPATTATEQRNQQVAHRMRVGAPAHQVAFTQLAPREFELSFNGPGVVAMFPVRMSTRNQLSDQRDPKTGYPLSRFTVELSDPGKRLATAAMQACQKDGGRWEQVESWTALPTSTQAERSRETLRAAGFSAHRVIELTLAPNLYEKSPTTIGEPGVDPLLHEVLRGETVSGRYRCNGSAGSQEVTLAVIAPVVLPPNGAELGLRFFLRWH